MFACPKRCLLPIAAASTVTMFSVLNGASAASASQQGLPAVGQSLGGHWRQLPSIDGPLMGSLPAGREIQIIEETDQSYEGFKWFKIEVGRQWGYQWGGIICSNGQKRDGLAAKCDPDKRLKLGAGAHGLASLVGRYTVGWGHEDGTQNDFCKAWDPQVDLGRLDIEADPGTLNYYSYDCAIQTTAPHATGLRIKGTCSPSADLTPGTIPFTRQDKALDVLAFQTDNGNTLILVDLTGPDRGLVSEYALCSKE